jgi:hypothetical protein
MIIPILIMFVVIIAFIIDAVKDLDLVPPLVLIAVIVASIMNYTECYYLVLALPLRYIINTLLKKNIVKTLGLKQVIIPFIQPLLYILSGILIGITAQKFLALPLDPWVAKTVFILCSYLALSLTISPSLLTLSTPINLLPTETETLSKIMYIVAIIIGIICTIYTLPYTSFYILIPLASVAVMLFYKNRIGFIWKYITIILFFLQLLVLTTILKP